MYNCIIKEECNHEKQNDKSCLLRFAHHRSLHTCQWELVF